jgi:hypothetical protein
MRRMLVKVVLPVVVIWAGCRPEKAESYLVF